MKTKETELILKREGVVELKDVKQSVARILSAMAPEKKLQCEMHTSDDETLFVFINNGICATLHIQAFEPIKKGGAI